MFMHQSHLSLFCGEIMRCSGTTEVWKINWVTRRKWISTSRTIKKPWDTKTNFSRNSTRRLRSLLKKIFLTPLFSFHRLSDILRIYSWSYDPLTTYPMWVYSRSWVIQIIRVLNNLYEMINAWSDRFYKIRLISNQFKKIQRIEGLAS